MVPECVRDWCDGDGDGGGNGDDDDGGDGNSDGDGSADVIVSHPVVYERRLASGCVCLSLRWRW